MSRYNEAVEAYSNALKVGDNAPLPRCPLNHSFIAIHGMITETLAGIDHRPAYARYSVVFEQVCAAWYSR